VSVLAIGAAEVVVQKNLDRDTNRALVERYIEQVGTNA
jgi:F0F1-type ATP synthase membrane subunit b/b'